MVQKFINKLNLVQATKNKMVKALFQFDDNTNRVLNLVKAKYGLKDKSEAVKLLVEKYIEMQMEPELKPEFIEKIRKIERQKSIVVDDFAKHYGLK